ncbi:MAG TPA: M1 family metallopeptidase [Bacteroidia bacterium]|nr:M1 family metallopeptidase [Bacteroidia bacterium]
MRVSAPLRVCVLIFLFLSANSFAQQLYIPRNIQKAFDKNTRAADGKPGKNYWQNFADYDLKIKFNPKSRLIEGTEYITYYNNSPDTLDQLVIRNYPDFFKRGGIRDWGIEPEDEGRGLTIEKLMIDDSFFDASEKNENVQRDGTNMTVKCHILPKHASKLEIKWSYILNKGSHVRTGQVDEGSHFIAYCFPRIAVYDDVTGWDENKYLGNNEPYFDFGNFNAEVTVPKNYVVWATGELQNADEVFKEVIVQKMNEAKASEKSLFVIDSLDLENKNVTAENKWNTFKFKAVNVPDFAFGTSDHYLWQASSMIVDSSSKRGAIINTVFNKTHKDYFYVHDFSRKTVEVMSYDFPGVPYPYPHITVFDGLDQMEYPMMVNDNPVSDRAENITLTDHEIFHTLFPFYMGINQTKYAWMDEGWATIAEWYISSKIDSALHDTYGVDDVREISGTENDVPLIIPATENKESYFVNAYPKPALVYWYLKDMLGEGLFRKSIQSYISSWNGKHPLPWDFFNSINTASGLDLNWFWKAWFYDYGTIDLGIKNVVAKDSSYDVIVEMKGNKPVPVYLNIEFTDGSKKIVHQSALVWKNMNKEVTIPIHESKSISKIRLENIYVPDTNQKDNVFSF